MTFDANICLDHVINFDVKIQGRPLKRDRTELVNQFIGKAFNKKDFIKLAYFANIRSETERNLFNAFTKQGGISSGRLNYPLSKFLLQSEEKLDQFFQKLHLLPNCTIQNEILTLNQFFNKYEKIVRQKGSTAEIPDVNDCELIVGTSKQTESKKFIASADGYLGSLSAEISQQYAVKVINFNDSTAVTSFDFTEM